ncbi:TOMM precursor leader peptide-binding protein [Kineococcus rhizosphaerae]|uniref:Bacteriocin biosynthesis cyclodehydratase domain-containing protein n=1 Tax=Kineococcus rhizosphaerae TaxID=559628 RepID=A0A2T0R412_9ACTN|nr:TOMM precursor leader peptide-binding protein [Kineococcus rhizosphaerae]PRY15117.1 bacteriocin biosynthesis cyclodehydratase domain-containing protein [Kineococcus rhizosphaerae]
MPLPHTPLPPEVPDGVPVARRPDGSVQVGSSPRSAVVIPAGRAAPGPGEPDPFPASGELLAWAAYDRHGPAPQARRRLRSRAGVAVVGPAATADALLAVLADAGVGRLLCDRDVPGTSPSRRPADLLVLVHDHVAHPVQADGAQADGVAHLSVVLRDTDAVVGPLVLPGRSACLRCLDRWRTDDDPQWPAVRDAFSRSAGRPADAATARAVAGLAALQVLTFLDGARPSTVGASLELLLPEGRVRQRWWRPHPACGCLDLPVR